MHNDYARNDIGDDAGCDSSYFDDDDDDDDDDDGPLHVWETLVSRSVHKLPQPAVVKS